MDMQTNVDHKSHEMETYINLWSKGYMTNYCQLPINHMEGYFPFFVFQSMELTWLLVAPSTF
jgi:hypothetical protein